MGIVEVGLVCELILVLIGVVLFFMGVRIVANLDSLNTAISALSVVVASHKDVVETAIARINTLISERVPDNQRIDPATLQGIVEKISDSALALGKINDSLKSVVDSVP